MGFQGKLSKIVLSFFKVHFGTLIFGILPVYLKLICLTWKSKVPSFPHIISNVVKQSTKVI